MRICSQQGENPHTAVYLGVQHYIPYKPHDLFLSTAQWQTQRKCPLRTSRQPAMYLYHHPYTVQ